MSVVEGLPDEAQLKPMSDAEPSWIKWPLNIFGDDLLPIAWHRSNGCSSNKALADAEAGLFTAAEYLSTGKTQDEMIELLGSKSALRLVNFDARLAALYWCRSSG